jgi:hypothetical protein
MFHSFMKSDGIIMPAAKRAIRKLAAKRGLEFRLQAVHRQNSDLPPEGGTPNAQVSRDPLISPENSRGKLQIPAASPDGAARFV